MFKKTKHRRFWTGVPPWIFIGAVAILFPIFAFMTVENIHRQKENSTRLLLEKGAALIRSFEAGTRAGMMEKHWGAIKLQKLLAETAQQPDIVYIIVIDKNKRIIAHNDPSQIKNNYGKGLDIKSILNSSDEKWRIVSEADGRNIFEVFRRFTPTGFPLERHSKRMELQRRLNPHFIGKASPPRVIFVGLAMSTIEEARREDAMHTVIMAAILLLIGCAGVILLFLAQSYRGAKKSLYRVKAFSDNLVENMPIGLVAIDSRGKIASFNNVAENILNLSAGKVIGENARESIPKDLWKQIEHLDTEKNIIEKEVNCCVADGKEIPLLVSANLLKDESNNFFGYIILFRDVVEIRSLRREVARSQHLASVGRLAAGVAHEVRNPLSSIKGFATYFKERYRDIPEDQQIANIMTQEVDRLNRVIGQLLEFTKPVAILKKSIDVGSFIENSLKLIERQAKEKSIKIQSSIAPEVEEIFVDSDKISQVLLNLYLNAIESMDKGGNLTVSVLNNKKRKGVIINIADRGIGIRDEEMGHIFDPYFTTKASGTGLGLAIAHNIIEAHDGEMNLKSKYRYGTTVSIFLPEKGKRKAI